MAGLLGITPRHIFRLLARGVIQGYRIAPDGHWRFNPQEVLAQMRKYPSRRNTRDRAKRRDQAS